VVTSRAPLQTDDDLFAPYEVIGELGARPTPVYVARQSALAVGGAQLVIAEHFPGASAPGDADLRREARRISTLANPHLARVREVAVRGDDLVVFGDFLDGEKLAEVWKPGDWLPIDVGLRVLLDVLTGVGALHGLRDANQQPMKLTHGELSPATILVGIDGVGRVLHSIARRAVGAVPEAASVPYLAPEVHTNDACDGRADVFSVGVLLWELVAGKPLTSEGEEPAGVRVRSAPLEAPEVQEKTPWAKALLPVVAKALAAAPEDRWSTAAVMAAEIRKAAGLKLAAASAAAAFAKTSFGDRVKARRTRWESRPSRPPSTVSSPRADVGPRVARSESEASLARLDSAAPAGSMPSEPAFEVPSARSEEFSSSVLESFRPPPPPSQTSPPASAPTERQMPASRVAAAVFASMPDVDSLANWDDPPPPIVMPSPASAPTPAIARASAFRASPPSVPIPSSAPTRVDPLGTTDRAGPPKEARKDSAISIPPLSALTSAIPEPPPSTEVAVPYEAPVVFDDADAGPITAPLGDPSPLPPALSSSAEPSRPRRRNLVLGGLAALAIAAVSVIVVHAHHAEAGAVAVQTPAPAPPPPSAQAPAPSSVAAQTPAPATVPAPASEQPAAPASSHAGTPAKKGAPVPKKPAAPGHPKSPPVRPSTHAKP
jgi:serine/threonine-protein kinase